MNFGEKEVNNSRTNNNVNKVKDRDKSSEPLEKRGSSSSKNIGQFILGEKLGEGTFGKVRLGTHICLDTKNNSILAHKHKN